MGFAARGLSRKLYTVWVAQIAAGVQVSGVTLHLKT